MTQIFMQDDVDKLLLNKFVVIIGDSVQRGVYKDLVMLLNKNKYLSKGNLRAKGETSFEGDELIEGGCKGQMTNGINYTEVRQYNSEDHLVRFYFITRCYNNYVESILLDLKKEPFPDVVMMNSCLWDITRYGRDAINVYKANLQKTIKRFKETLPESCMFLWNCTLPISRNARGGFLIPEVEFMNGTLRLDIIEANFYARGIVSSFKYDVLDLHFHLRYQLHRRSEDGIHWDMTAHRRITNLILTHIARAWNFHIDEALQESDDISVTINYNSPLEHHRRKNIDMAYNCQINTNTDYNMNGNYTRSHHQHSNPTGMTIGQFFNKMNGFQNNSGKHRDRRLMMNPYSNNSYQYNGNNIKPIRYPPRHYYHPYIYNRTKY